jgi:hypothetical protein
MSYRGCAVREVFEGIVRLRGFTPDITGMSASDRGNVASLVNAFLREDWEGEWWPESMQPEQRQFAPTWDAAVNYATDEAVLREDATGAAHYFLSVVDGNLGNDPNDGDETLWVNVDQDQDFRRAIALDQEWEAQRIGRIDVEQHVFDSDPRLSRVAVPLADVFLVGGEIVFRGAEAPARPWLKFQLPAPEFSWTDWSAGTLYGIGDRVYRHESGGVAVGHTFVALAPSTGADPYTNSDQWAEVPFPDFLKHVVIHQVAAEEMREDEARYKERSLADRLHASLRERLIEGQGGRRRAVR